LTPRASKLETTCGPAIAARGTPDKNQRRIVGACHREQLTELRGVFLVYAQACSFAQRRAAPRKCGRRRSCTLAVRITAQLALALCTQRCKQTTGLFPEAAVDELTPWTLLPLVGSPSAQLESSQGKSSTHEMQHPVYVNIEGMGIAIKPHPRLGTFCVSF